MWKTKFYHWLFASLIFQQGKVGFCDKIVDNFQTFSTNLEDSFAQTDEASETRPGVHLTNPFGVGYALANIHESLWNISVSGIPAALQNLDGKYTAGDFAHLLDLLKKSNFKVSSTIYSRFANVTTKSLSLSQLKSHVITLDYVANPAKFVDSFSSLIDTATKGHLDNELLPKALWNTVFDNYTQGAYINTLYHKVRHVKPWASIGTRSFNQDAQVPFLELEGEFPLFQDDNITVVILNVQQVPKQSLVLARSHSQMPISQLTQEVRQLLSTPINSTFTPTSLRVQVPQFKATNMIRHNLGLKLMGVNETFCNTNGTIDGDPVPIFVQQPIIQSSFFQLAPGFLEFTSATGSVITSNSRDLELDLEEEYDEEDVASIIVKDEEDDYENENSPFLRTALKMNPFTGTTHLPVSQVLRKLGLKAPSSFSKPYPPSRYQFQVDERRKKKREVARIVDEFITDDTKCKTPEEFYPQSKITRYDYASGEGSNGQKTLTFDTPFLFLLHDEVLRETFSGAVSSLCTYNKVLDAIRTSSIHSWLQDVFKVAFWKCF